MKMNSRIKFNQSLFIAGFLTLASAPVLAASAVTVPNTFAAGEIIKADQMNANFSAIVDGITNIALTPGPQGETGATGPSGADGADGSSVSGNTQGDMQYWDGTAWVLIAAPTGVISGSTGLNFCIGVPTWGLCTYAIGDTGPAGGIVFYITDGGAHGMEAAPVDQSAGGDWGCAGDPFIGADGTTIGTGAWNTADIVTRCTSNFIAAKVAHDYTFNGYGDWFLPSKDELNLLNQQKAVVGGFVSDYYWSSSQINSLRAWAQSFSFDDQIQGEKNDSLIGVRAVRAF